MDKDIIQFPVNENDNEENGVANNEEDTIDLGQMKIPPMIVEVRNFFNLSNGAQLVAFIDVETEKLTMMKGTAIYPVVTSEGVRGKQVELDFPVEDAELELMEHVNRAFDSYDEVAEIAVAKDKKDREDANRIVTASGLPFDPKGNK